ncbi:hypothetical protein BV898_12846 [Hypsibius exemplaris]|uniref:Fungal lipase-like domain-containing protein n=1 Tax=Hypsibius exemplaris TaxID=2072580 RepID=A0A1W0WCH5_HYPEX|nr:hypothetical protein BV898_12846 [Hypsibius exemplaris]
MARTFSLKDAKDAATYAVLAGQAYKKIDHQKIPAGWKSIFQSRPVGGWDVAYGIFTNEKRNEVVLAIKGTDDVFNYISDASLVVSALTGRPVVPPDQDRAETIVGNVLNHLNNTFTAPENDFDRTNHDLDSMGIAIRNLQGDIGRPIADWVYALMYVAAISAGIYAVGQVASLDVVTSLAVGAVLVGVTARNLQIVDEQVTERLKMVLTERSGTIDKVYEAIHKRCPGKTLKIVGHSLGAVTAELCAVKFGVECITFDSPGSLEILQTVDRYRDLLMSPGHVRITNYFSAPNIVNTLNGHPGESIRLFLPHTDGQFSPMHRAVCVLSSASRVATYVGLGAVGAFFGRAVAQKAAEIAAKEVAEIAAQEAAKVAAKEVGKKAGLASLSAKLTGGVAGLWKDKNWLLEQHKIDSFIAYLSSTTTAPKTAVVESWPQTLNFGGFKARAVDVIRASVLPLQKDLPGIRNQFDEEGMREAQIERMVGYKVGNVTTDI